MEKDLEIKAGIVFEKNATSNTRYTFNCGGTRSGKTYAINQLFYKLAAESQEHLILSIVSETMPHLKRGAMRDFELFLKQYGLYDNKKHNKTDNIYYIGNSFIEFFSADSTDKVHGPERDYLFVNEIQNITYDTFFHLVARTRKQVFADYNPVEEFWVDTEYLNNEQYKGDLTYIHSTLFHNPFISDEIKKDVIRRSERDKNYRKVYLEGKIGSREGLVYDNYRIIDEMPECKIHLYGMDFGFTNDPTSLIEVGINGNNIYLDEKIYSTHLNNREILKLLFQNGVLKIDEIIADCAEPKTIDEIYAAGYNIHPSVKGPDSIRNGIDIVKRFNIFVTKSSVNLIKELRNYRWATDKTGKSLNKPIDMFNHALDAVRYAVSHKMGYKMEEVEFMM